MSELEELRNEYLQDFKAGLGKDAKKALDSAVPGSYACHEALQMSSFLVTSIDEQLLAHPSIVKDKEWFALAATAHRALFDLYQAIGAKHDGAKKGS